MAWARVWSCGVAFPCLWWGLSVTPVCFCGYVDILSCLRYGWQISHHTTACYWDTGLLLHAVTSIATKRSSHLLRLPRTGSYPLTPAQNQGDIILVRSILLSTTPHFYLSKHFTASSSAWLSILAYLLFQHGTKKSLLPLQYTCSCQPYRRQLRMSTQPQKQTGVTLSPHHRQGNATPQDQTPAQAIRTPPAWTDSAHTHYYHRQTETTCYIHVLYHLHTRSPTLCKPDLVPLPTLILIIVLCYIISI